MKYEANTIVFDSSDAARYDETRPFMPPEKEGELLPQLCALLQQCARPGASYIELVDLGAGTGRVALPLARQYARFRQHSHTVPKLRITCVDLSEAMLSCLETRWAAESEQVKDSVEIVREPLDVRDIGNQGHRFDAAFAHWIFHLIEDWRLAVYAIDQSLLPSGRLFLFTENSSLYSAIDGDVRGVTDPKIADLWRAFYSERAKFDARSPRIRLGTLVIDDRIEGMFNVLGWAKVGEDIPAAWTTNRKVRWVIDKIIEPRSFTNMQLHDDTAEAISEYSAIAARLRESFAEYLGSPWPIWTEFSIRMLKRNRRRIPARQVLIDVARATVALRRQQPLLRERSFVPVWGRLLRETWGRLNQQPPGQDAPIGALFVSGKARPIGTYISAPSAAQLRKEECAVWTDEATTPFWSCANKAWDELTRAMETCEPFALCIGLTQDALIRVKNEWMRGARVHPSIRLLSVGEAAVRGLVAIASRVHEAQCEASVKNALREAAQGAKWCVDLLHDAARLGLIPYSYENVAVPFLSGVARLVIANIPVCYLMPAVPPRADASEPALGVLVASRQALPSDVTTALWLLGETVLTEYFALPPSATSSIDRCRNGAEEQSRSIGSDGESSEVPKADVPRLAAQLLASLVDVPLDRYRVAGDYVRYEPDTLRELRRIVTWLRGVCEGRTSFLENMLLWGPSGQGKTFLVKEVARAISAEFIEVDLKDQQLNEEIMRQTLDRCRIPDTAHLCLIDEVDSRLTEDWPFEVLYSFLEINQKKAPEAPNNVFVLVGSTPGGIEALELKIQGAKKGHDLLTRVPKKGVIPQLSLGDRLLVVLSQVRRMAMEAARQVVGVDKDALLYILCESDLSNARRLSDFIRRALGRMKPQESVLSLWHLVEPDEFKRLYVFLEGGKQLVEVLKSKTLYLAD